MAPHYFNCAMYKNQLYKVSEKFELQRLNWQEEKWETLTSIDIGHRR